MDATTMILALALGNLALCAVLYCFTDRQGDSLGLSAWGGARQAQAVAWGVLYLGALGVLPEALALAGGYALLIAGVGWEAGAQWEAAGRLRWRRFAVPLIVAAVAIFAACSLADVAGLRTVALSLILGGLYLLGAAALLRDWRRASGLQRMLALATVVLALAIAARGLMVLLAPGGWAWLNNRLLRQVAPVALYLLALVNAFGLLLLGREKLQAELVRLDTIDALTGVPNQRGFFAALAPWLALGRRPGLPTALMLLDLDQFKRVNDSYGHAAADAVLRSVVDACRRQLRDSDFLGRMAGVEFAILLPRTSQDDAAIVAERIRAAIAAAPVKAERALIGMTASFGVTTIRPDDSTVSLLARADLALRAAKDAGRDRVEQAPPASVPVA
jgi:diguanylate cyclase (GGDEF)-like protein